MTDNSDHSLRNVVIVGSGPAGYTAALYAARANLEPLVIAGREHGGQLMLTTDVENYPGYPEGVQGPQMMEDFREQAERFGAEVVFKDVVEVHFDKHPFVLRDDDDNLVEANAVILTAGASARWLGVPGEDQLRGHGVSSCATCDGAFFKQAELFVVGGGDSAMEESLFLTKFADRVTVLHRRDEFRASKIMQDRFFDHAKTDVMWNTEVLEILGDGSVEAARIATHPEGRPKERLDEADGDAEKAGVEVREAPVDGVFIAIGHTPNTDFLDGSGVEMDEQGYILRKDNSMTSVPGVFAGGDCVDHRYRQAVTAAGQGCEAAMDAEKWLEAEGLVE